MAAHRWHLTASIYLSLTLLAGPAPAVAAQQRVPDEAALTEYTGALPGADGPLLPGPGSAGTAPAGPLPARVDAELARLTPERGDALRRLATDRSLGAPARAVSRAGDGAAQPGSRAGLAAPEPSTLSAVLGAMAAAPISAMLLAVLLVVGLLATAGTRRRGGSPG